MAFYKLARWFANSWFVASHRAQPPPYHRQTVGRKYYRCEFLDTLSNAGPSLATAARSPASSRLSAPVGKYRVGDIATARASRAEKHVAAPAPIRTVSGSNVWRNNLPDLVCAVARNVGPRNAHSASGIIKYIIDKGVAVCTPQSTDDAPLGFRA